MEGYSYGGGGSGSGGGSNNRRDTALVFSCRSRENDRGCILEASRELGISQSESVCTMARASQGTVFLVFTNPMPSIREPLPKTQTAQSTFP